MSVIIFYDFFLMKTLFFALMFFLAPMEARAQNDPSLPSLGGNIGEGAEDGEVLSFMELRRKNINYSSNVDSFDVAGLKIGENPTAVIATAEANGFRLKHTIKKIPTFLEWQHKRDCLKDKGPSYATLKTCVMGAAEDHNQRYVETLVFEKREMKEKLTVSFTSPFQDNVAYRIVYKSTGNHSWNSSEEGRYLKQKRWIDFWTIVARKYGTADDEELMVWGNSEEGATLQIKMTPSNLDAYVTLENLTMLDRDTENQKLSDQTTMNKFSF